MTKRFYALGEQVISAGTAVNYYFTKDHLGSVREMTDSTGAIRARYDYDPYGRTTKLSGDLDADFGFDGMYYHATSGLYLTWHRPYDPILARWSSKDPIGESGGINLYSFVRNNPINLTDPLGLCPPYKNTAPYDNGNLLTHISDAIPKTSQWLAPTSFDNTFIGSYSLLNLFNGNTLDYGAELTVGYGAKLSVGVPLANGMAPGGGAAFADAAPYVGGAVTAVVTGVDVTDRIIQHGVQQAIQNLPVNDPTNNAPGVDMGGGVYMQDDYGSLRQSNF